MNDNALTNSADKIHFLKQLDIFSSLNLDDLEFISRRTRLIEFKKEEVIYKEGDPANAFYIVLSGRLRIVKEQPSAEENILDYLHKGDYFGEVSLLTNEPHSVTIKAHNDSILLKLSREDFNEIIHRMPAIAIPLSRVLSRRLRQRYQRVKQLGESRVISIYSAGRGVGSTVFAMNLAIHLYKETNSKVILLDMSLTGSEISTKLRISRKRPLVDFEYVGFVGDETIKREIQDHPYGFKILNVGHTEEDESDEKLIAPLLSYLTESFNYVIIDLPNRLDKSIFKALTQSDLIYIVCDTKEENLLKTDTLIKRLKDSIHQLEDKIRVVLNCVNVQEELPIKKTGLLQYTISHCLPTTPALLSVQDAQASRFLASPDSSYSRVTRFIAREVSGMLVGLALGSGAALGLAHIGVLKIFEKEGLPVDIIAGASIGALIAAFWASGKSAAELEGLAIRMRKRFNLLKLIDIEYPLMGFIQGRAIEKYLKSILGEKTFEDVAIPLRIVSANPATREEVIFKSGRLVDAVRSSISIPGIFHPVVRQGHLQIDGGVVSPVPVEALRKAGANRIIAINVFPSTEDILRHKKEVDEKEQMWLKRLKEKNLFIRLGHTLKESTLRHFRYNAFDVIMRSMQSMEYYIAEAACRNADVVIRPVVASATWMDFFNAERFIKKGEEEALRMLSQIKQLVSSKV